MSNQHGRSASSALAQLRFHYQLIARLLTQHVLANLASRGQTLRPVDDEDTPGIRLS